VNYRAPKLSRSTLHQIFWSALVFGLLFSIIAMAQYYYVESQLMEMAVSQASRWADEVDRGINYRDHWDLREYLQAELDVGGDYFVITRDGYVVDIYGYHSDSFPAAKLPNEVEKELSLDRVVSVRSPLGEPWLLTRERVTGGQLVLGIRYASNAREDSLKLRNASKALRSVTAEEIIKGRGRGIDAQIEFAVFDAAGKLAYQSGGIALEIPEPDLKEISEIGPRTKILGGRKYLFFTKPIIDQSNAVVGAIVVPQSLELQQGALDKQRKFNFTVAAVSWALILALVVGYFVTNELKRRQQEISLDEALKKGEGQMIEFKAGVPEDILPQIIAAFANSDGGNLFLGVDDNGTVVGLKEKTTKEKDTLLLRIRSAMDQSITPRVLLYPTFLSVDNKSVLRIFVPRGTRPIYLVKGVAYIRHMNAVVRAKAEDLEEKFKRWST
jgi:hypothetical protein